LVEVCPWNLAQYSEDFSNAVWTLANVTVTANDITAPNGTLTADKFTISVNGCDVKQTISVLPNTVYTWSFYVYGGTALGQQGRFYDNTNLTNIEYYNYSSSVVLGAWVKIERTFTTPSGCYEIQAWVLAATSTIGTMWAWGAQLNIGSTAKPYFPTTDRLNVPRLTYQNGGGGCPSLLLEKQSTNLLWPSEDFSNANWAQTNCTITANDTTSPDGTQNADKLTTASTSAENEVRFSSFSINTNVGSSYTTTVFAKKGTANFLRIRNLFVTDGGTNGNAWFNLNTGAVGTVQSSQTASIQNMGNGWYRCSLTGVVGSVLNLIDIGFTDTDNTNFPSSNVNGYIWGAQLEESSYPTSYISTTSASATRVADACSKTGISSLIGQTEGTMFVEVDLTHTNGSGTNQYLMQLYQDSGNRVIVFRTSANELNYYFLQGATAFFSTTTITTNGRHKLAFAYKSGDSAFYIDGVQIATNSTSYSAFSSLTELQIGANFNPTQAEIGDYNYNQAVIFKTRLTNAELASLTTI
jgi:hypothetical protein